VAVISSLIKYDVDVNARDSNGNTALLVWGKDRALTSDLVEMLLQAGADITVTNISGQNVLQLLTADDDYYYDDNDCAAIVFYLIEHGLAV
jgi:ankyrin repeat protein